MNFKFWKKLNVRKERRKIYVPEDKKRRLLDAYDKLTSAPSNCDALLNYDFWKMAEEVCPEVKEGKWIAMMKNGTMPYFYEVLS